MIWKLRYRNPFTLLVEKEMSEVIKENIMKKPQVKSNRVVAQRLEVLAALAEDWSWIPSPHGDSEPAVAPVPQGSFTPYDLYGHYVHMIRIQTFRQNTYKHKNKIGK